MRDFLAATLTSLLALALAAVGAFWLHLAWDAANYGWVFLR